MCNQIHHGPGIQRRSQGNPERLIDMWPAGKWTVNSLCNSSTLDIQEDFWSAMLVASHTWNVERSILEGAYTIRYLRQHLLRSCLLRIIMAEYIAMHMLEQECSHLFCWMLVWSTFHLQLVNEVVVGSCILPVSLLMLTSFVHFPKVELLQGSRSGAGFFQSWAACVFLTIFQAAHLMPILCLTSTARKSPNLSSNQLANGITQLMSCRSGDLFVSRETIFTRSIES